MAVVAGILDDRAAAIAGRTGALGHDIAEHRLLAGCDLAGALALAAFLRLGAVLGPGALARVAKIFLGDGDGPFNAESRFHEIEIHTVLEVGAPLWASPAPAAAKAPTKERAKQIFNVEIEPAAIKATKALPINTRMAELVILGPFVSVAEHGIRLVRFLELGLGIFVALVEVRVVLLGYLAIGLFDFIIACAFADAQYFVIIALFSHVDSSDQNLRKPAWASCGGPGGIGSCQDLGVRASLTCRRRRP